MGACARLKDIHAAINKRPNINNSNYVSSHDSKSLTQKEQIFRIPTISQNHAMVNIGPPRGDQPFVASPLQVMLFGLWAGIRVLGPCSWERFWDWDGRLEDLWDVDESWTELVYLSGLSFFNFRLGRFGM